MKTLVRRLHEEALPFRHKKEHQRSVEIFKESFRWEMPRSALKIGYVGDDTEGNAGSARG